MALIRDRAEERQQKERQNVSAAMIAPENVSFMWKVFVRISGTMLSYICQNAQMDKNARPTRMVRLLLSFISVLPFLMY